MLFKKKDSNSSSQAKTSLFASKAKKADAAEKEALRAAAPAVSAKGARATDATLKTTIAAGKTNAEILRNPRITEKATTVASGNVYTFDVASFANKKQIAEAIKDVYRVTPIGVRVVTIPTLRVVSRRGTHGTTGGGKKAYVTLKKGDTIELV